MPPAFVSHQQLSGIDHFRAFRIFRGKDVFAFLRAALRPLR